MPPYALALLAFVGLVLLMYVCRSSVEPFDDERSVLPSHPDGPTYDPAKYNTDPYVQNAHNCYAYAMDFYDPALADRCKTLITSAKTGAAWPRHRLPTCFQLRPKPGRVNGTHGRLSHSDRMHCKRMLDGVLEDVPSATVVTREAKCPTGFYKIAYAVDPGRTYHFYRQDADGKWSHKDAWRAATRLDASGKLVADPATADRRYTHANLRDFCHYLCVPLQTHTPTILQ